MKTILPSELEPQMLQMIMQTAVAPRPIALVSTVDSEGNPNLSPFSFFNMFSTVPPVLIFSPARRVRDNTTKHTLENILEVPEAVVANVSYAMVQQTSLSSTEYDKGVNEFVKSGFTILDADLVKPKLVGEAFVNFECKVLEVKPLGTEGGAGNLIICEVVKLHLSEKCLNDKGLPDQAKMDLVARLGANWYSRNNAENLFEVPKPLVTKGIGIDALPDALKNSKILTGNDLGMLANTEQLPEGKYTEDEAKHTAAQEALHTADLLKAWEILRT